mmetsp:Transcript_52046/g.83077  ORF Transcript_52046/g.83077 Transcript_52046/m.83077 type:complete len:260 (+) Transcript_52046:398-1177(+)
MEPRGIHLAAAEEVLPRQVQVLGNADAKLMHEAQIEGGPCNEGLHPFTRHRHVGSLAISRQRRFVVDILRSQKDCVTGVDGWQRKVGPILTLFHDGSIGAPLLRSEARRAAPAIIGVVAQAQLTGSTALLRRELVEALSYVSPIASRVLLPKVVIRFRRRLLASFIWREQVCLAAIEEMCYVHLGDFMPCFREFQEHQRGLVGNFVTKVVGRDQFAAHPFPALTDLLQEIHRNVTVPDCPDAIQVHHCQGVSSWSVSPI